MKRKSIKRYPMLLLVNQDKLCRYIKLTCINVNISKLMYMGLYIFTPFTTRSKITDTETSNFYEIRHYILIFISLSTILYHATIFYYIRTRFCMKYKEIMKSQNFLTKFRRISQYRIMISSGYILCSTPFIIFYIFIILFDRRKAIDSGEYVRNTFFNVPYYIIYIDQILLKNLVVVKPTSNAPPPYLNRNSACSAASATSATSDSDSKNDERSNSNSLKRPDTNVRPQVTARPMLFNNWSAPQGWGKPEYMKPSDKQNDDQNQNQDQNQDQNHDQNQNQNQNQGQHQTQDPSQRQQQQQQQAQSLQLQLNRS